MNEQYLSMLEQIQAAFRQDPQLPVVALQQILSQEEFTALQERCVDGWQQTTIPDQYSYAIRELPPFEELRAFVQQVTGQTPLAQQHRRFQHRDFTLLHDTIQPEPGVLAFLFLEDWNEDWGGSLVFMHDGEMLGRFTPQANTLLLVERKPGVQEFLQYINHKAQYPLTILSL